MTEKFDSMLFGSKLRGKRAELRMSQGDLADKSGVDINSIARYEIGDTKPGLDKAVALANALGVTLDDLYPIRAATIN